MRRAGAGLAALLLAGCTVGPNYVPPPPVASPEGFTEASTTLTTADEPVERWWTQLQDPVLDGLIDQALKANLDLKAAAANVEAARATRDAAAARRIPALDGTVVYEHARSSAATNLGEPDVREPSVDLSEGLLNLSWELDLFGRVRRSVEAAEADEAATEDQRRQMQTIVVADLATSYIDLRGAELRLEVARRNAKTERDTFELTETLSDAGRGTDLDIARARAQLETTLATVPPLNAEIVADRSAIAVLIGVAPEALGPTLDKPAPLPRMPSFVAVGSPASLLRRRPDVAEAERTLAGATARIGVAVADLFPTVSFGAGIGVEALHPGDLTKAGAPTFQVGPSITFPIFDLSLYARVRNADATAAVTLAQFQKSVLTALSDTETALSRYQEERARRGNLATASEASTRAAELADTRYRFGAENFLTVLDAQRTELSAEDALAQSDIAVAEDLVVLYRALGGGWTATAETAMAGPDPR